MTLPAPPQPPIAPGVGRIGKHRNVILVWLIWPIITLGIYSLVWWYKINRETHDFDRRIDVSPGVAVLAIVPGFILLVPPFVTTFRTGKCLHVIYMQSHLNGLWAVYNSPTEGTEVQLQA
jgi:hypothetical protein